MRFFILAIAVMFTLSACKNPQTPLEGHAQHGKKQWKRLCSSCHSVEVGQSNRRGPNLFAVVGRKAGSLEGFQGYSAAMKAWGQVWDQALIEQYLIHPAGFLQKQTQNPKATSTMNVRIKDEAVRHDIAAYLASLSDGWAFKNH